MGGLLEPGASSALKTQPHSSSLCYTCWRTINAGQSDTALRTHARIVLTWKRNPLPCWCVPPPPPSHPPFSFGNHNLLFFRLQRQVKVRNSAVAVPPPLCKPPRCRRRVGGGGAAGPGGGAPGTAVARPPAGPRRAPAPLPGGDVSPERCWGLETSPGRCKGRASLNASLGETAASRGDWGGAVGGGGRRRCCRSGRSTAEGVGGGGMAGGLGPAPRRRWIRRSPPCRRICSCFRRSVSRLAAFVV